MSSKLLKGALVVFGAIGISVLGLFASDGLRGVGGNLGALTGSAGVCPAGMTELKREGSTQCVDTYEASASESCPHKSPGSVIETEANLGTKNCYAASVSSAMPWRFVSLPQAQRLCAQAGKRLPRSSEWYKYALGTEAENCVIDTNTPAKTGSNDCRSSSGIHDMVGNLWEWTDEQVTDHTFMGRALPSEGYVDEVDANGIALATSEGANELYGADYFWSKEEGVFGMIRGGFYGSNGDAGLYAVNASVPTSLASPGVGFRCVEDVI